MMVDTSTTSSSAAAATSACSVETAWPARVNMPSYEVKDMAVHEVAPIQMPTSGLYHLKSVSAALDENLKYHPTRITSSSNRDQVQNNWREQPVCIIGDTSYLLPKYVIDQEENISNNWLTLC